MGRGLVAIRWLLVVGWILGAGACYLWLPSYSKAVSGASQLVTVSTPAIAAEERAAREFGFPLTNQSVLVQHNSKGLPLVAQTRVVERAVRIDAHSLASSGGQLVAALPVLNTGGVFPTSRHPGTTALTYLYFQPSTSPSAVQTDVNRLVCADISHPGDSYVGATGLFSSEQDQGNLIGGSLRLIEGAALAVVFLVIASPSGPSWRRSWCWSPSGSPTWSASTSSPTPPSTSASPSPASCSRSSSSSWSAW